MGAAVSDRRFSGGQEGEIIDLWETRATAAIADTLIQSITQVAQVAGVERVDLPCSERGEEFHSDARVFPRHLV